MPSTSPRRHSATSDWGTPEGRAQRLPRGVALEDGHAVAQLRLLRARSDDGHRALREVAGVEAGRRVVRRQRQHGVARAAAHLHEHAGGGAGGQLRELAPQVVAVFEEALPVFLVKVVPVFSGVLLKLIDPKLCVEKI